MVCYLNKVLTVSFTSLLLGCARKLKQMNVNKKITYLFQVMGSFVSVESSLFLWICNKTVKGPSL